MATKSEFPWGWVLGGISAAAVLGAGLLLTPRQKQGVGDAIDRVVAWLNGTFGKTWVQMGLTALKSALPPQLAFAAQVLNAVFHAEQIGASQGWSGLQKHQYAAQRC